MAPTTYLPGNLQWLGLAKETTYGTPAAAPTMWIPVDSPKWAHKVTPLKDKALRGMMSTTFNQAQGMAYTDFSYKTMLYPDSLFPHMLATLGVADTVVTLTAPTLTLGATATTGGTLPAGATYWKITATATGGEGVGSNEVTATLTGSTSSQPLSWTAVTGASGYNIYRGTAAGAENILVASVGTVTTYTDTGAAGTAGTPPTTAASLHKTSVLNVGTPPSYTGFLYMADTKVKQIPGLVIASLKIGIKANELPSMDISWLGMPSTTINAPANTPSVVPPMPPFTANIKVGGASLGKYSDASITIKRGSKAIPVLNGTQSPLAIYAGEVTVTGTLGAIFQGTADNDLTNLLTNGQPTLAVSINPQNDGAHPLTLQCSKIAYETADPAPASSGWMTISSNFEAIANATDALDGNLSPIQAILSTTSSTAY
ncbi:phage tail tube protein [Arthrobacter liuii]|uniref:Uncharacterized protein n=1 Tax=Arthrobacter liuii TaxID=1476996 RepID=A0ABQ2ALY8_9MICC|nr:phage tail tube protein [Arthrobacter liuii]GGH93745.1 hypothetical protein GCM10007170_15330 [Arthrobacter liuii]